MKNVIKFFSFMALLSVFAIACNQHDIVEDGGDLLINKPLDYTYPMKSVDLGEFDSEFGQLIIKNNGIAKRENCPALDHALAQIAALNENCEYDELYCLYLALWWRMEEIMAGINCDIDYYCSECADKLQIINASIGILEERGLLPFYVQHLSDKRDEYAILCTAGCDG